MANPNSRKAGSEEFKQILNKESTPFASRNREKAQSKYDAYEERGYDELTNRETYQAKKQHNRLKEGGRFDRQDAARAGMGEGGFNFGGKLKGYDSAAAGGKGFNMSDVKYLKENGASDKQINKYISGLDNVGESLKNNSEYGGTHYRGDMDKSKGIDEYDMGKGFNKADIKYLRGQGYGDEEIADYGLSTEKGHGAATARFLDKQGALATRAKNTFDPRQGPGAENNDIQPPAHQAPPDLSEHQDRVDAELGKDAYGNQIRREAEKKAADTDTWDSQAFLNKYITANRFAQQGRSDGSEIANKYITSARENNRLDVVALDKSIRQAPLVSAARSELAGLQTFGDKYRNSRENGPSWTNPDAPKPYEPPNFKDIYDQGKKDIDDI